MNIIQKEERKNLLIGMKRNIPKEIKNENLEENRKKR